MRCPACNQDIKDDAKFCMKCGKKIPRCPTCGALISRRIRFCVNDGTPLPKDIWGVFSDEEEAEEKKSSLPLLIIVGTILVLVIFAFAGYVVFRNGFSLISSSVHDAEDSESTNRFSEEDGGEQVLSEAEKEEPEEEENEMIHTYEIIAGDLSWQEAETVCEEMGGHLATITSEEEYEEICELASDSGLMYLWLGSCLESDSEEWENNSWITGEKWTFSRWYPGEPSREDADGTKEDYLCLWNAKYNGEEIGWTFNDQRDDIVGAFPSAAGTVGYICEYETEAD